MKFNEQKFIDQEFPNMNNMQRKAIISTEVPLLILAGAGSGKTTVLVNRIANIIKSGKAKPWEILAITFTNKAAGELKERLSEILSSESSDIWASTFHSTCAKILRINSDMLGYTPHFSIYDSEDSKRLIKECQKELNIDDKILSYKSILSEISHAKDQMKDEDQFEKNSKNDNRLSEIAKVYKLYQKRLLEADAMDFDDLLFNTVKLFKNNRKVLEKYQDKFQYILVDEYQDTNLVQYEMIKLLAKKNNRICVVGDDDQSIYKFRGATIENILNFEKTFKNAEIIKLEQNYRSTQTILDAANSIIKNNSERKGKNLWTKNNKGEKISMYTASTEQDEASYIANIILDEVAKGRNYSDFSILYRMNSQSNNIEKIFIKSGIPYRIIGGLRFYERKEIKDLMAYLNIINNSADDTRLKRIINYPKRSIGDKTIAHASDIAKKINKDLFYVIKNADKFPELSRASIKLKTFSDLMDKIFEFADNKSHSLHELYNFILDETNYINCIKKEKEDYENRVQNIQELDSNILKYEEENGDSSSLSGFLEEVSLMTDIDNKDDSAQSVVMMTMHSAKGLEFPVVFLPGFEEGIFPGVQAIYNPSEIEEERRLAYVGVTRAKEKLHIINAQTRMLFGSTSRNKPSRFSKEIPSELLDVTVCEAPKVTRAETSAVKREKEAKRQSLTFEKNYYHKKKSLADSELLFNAGDAVLHKTFGEGTIVSSIPVGNDSLLEINFSKVGTKKLLSNFAHLQMNSSIVNEI